MTPGHNLSQIVVTLVHGTWGRGVFPALRISTKPFWFESGGILRKKLSAELQSRGLACTFQAFLWSGANSIYHRDEAARQLAERITFITQQKPGSRQVIIAHSHGGNVAARALGLSPIDPSEISVVYLATPFVQLFPRTVSLTEKIFITLAFFFLSLVSVTIIGFIIYLFVHFFIFDMTYFGYNNERWLISSAFYISIGNSAVLYQWLGSEKARLRNESLIQATTSLTREQAHGNALIVRAIDDEASLALSAGTIASLLSSRFLMIPTVFLLVWAEYGDRIIGIFYNHPSELMKFSLGPQVSFVSLITLFATMLMAIASRAVYGRELLSKPPGTQINAQSVPDFIGSAKIFTLLRNRDSKSAALRHGIYSHPDAATIIADWISAEIHEH